jgi:hypothetical protein
MTPSLKFLGVNRMQLTLNSILSLMLSGTVTLSAQTRPHNPFVEKVVTPERSRQLKVALDPNLWIMYDMPTAELYVAWKGGTAGGSLKSADEWYGTSSHFPHHFNLAGAEYFRESVGEFFSDWAPAKDISLYYTKWPKQPLNYQNWSVTTGGVEVFQHVANHGYFIKGAIFKFHNGLKLKGGGEIDVLEIPEYDGTGGKVNLVRKLTFTGIPTGGSVKLSLPNGGNWTVTGKGILQAGALVQSIDGESTITGSW